MRENVLPLADYEIIEGEWVKGGKRPIPDEEVEKHHTRLVLTNPDLRKAAIKAAVAEILKKIRSEKDNN